MEVVARGALAALAYYAAARLGHAFTIPNAVVTLWPPAGVMLALLVLSPRREWAAIALGGMLGSVASDIQSGDPAWLALAASTASGVESVVAAWVVTRTSGAPWRFTSVRRLMEFIVLGVFAANAATAMLGALTLHAGRGTPLATAWMVWWVGDGLGMLVVAPALIACFHAADRRTGFAPTRVLEATLLLFGLALISHIVFGPPRDWVIRPGPYATIPFLLWAGIRFGPPAAALASFLVATYAVWNAALGVGPLAASPSTTVNTALQVYVFLLVVTLCALVPAVALEERTIAEVRRQESEARAGESEERHRAVVEAATDAIITIDEASVITFANAAAEGVFGYSREALLGRSLTTLMPERFRERHRAAIGRYIATGTARIAWRGVPLVGLHKDGREIPLEVSFGDRVENGRRVFTGVLRDVSERDAAQRALRAAEDRMRFALEAARLGVWEVNFATGEARWSETLEELHGMVARSFGGTLDAFMAAVHADDREQVREAMETATREHSDANFLYRTVWPDGSVHWISGTGRTTYDADGTPIRAAGIGMDVTERRALEERYRQSQKMEAVGQLAGGIAHDFNNMLTAILSYASLVSDALGAESPQRKDLDEITAAADRAAAMTRQLLAFSRQQILDPRVIDLGTLVRSIEPMLRRLIGEHIEIVVRVAPNAGSVMADPTQIEQVVLNLALNARDAMPDGGTLSLEVTNAELGASEGRTHTDVARGPHVMLAVSDTGHGMDAATAARIFEPFFTTKPQGKGTGLGLATVHGIVKQSGGAVSVDTEPGKGTTFKVFLPRVNASEAAPTASVPGTSERRGSETILVTEDDEVILRLASRILTRRGFTVLAAGTPRAALDYVANYPETIDLLLTDAILPEMSGRALADEVTKRRPNTRVLFMSGYTDDAVVRRGVLEHGTEFVQKPFDPETLVERVRETLDKQIA